MTSSRKVDPLSNSKKISKASPGSSNLSKYKIFDTETKNKVLTDLKREIIIYFQLLLTEDEVFGGDELIKQIDQFPLTDYNRALLQILKRHGVYVEDKTRSLTSWRKKIKAWIKADGKPETRGGLVIPVELLAPFKARVWEILENLPYRSLPLLREKILNVLRELQQTNDVNDKTCSKHWWFNFMKKNPDIKEKWEKIDLERTTVKKSKKKRQDLESTDDEDDEGDEGESDQNSLSQPHCQEVVYASSPSRDLPEVNPEEIILENLRENGGLNYRILKIHQEEEPTSDDIFIPLSSPSSFFKTGESKESHYDNEFSYYTYFKKKDSQENDIQFWDFKDLKSCE